MAGRRPEPSARPAALVAVADGTEARATLAMLAEERYDVERTAARGQDLVARVEVGRQALVVVELSRLGEVGLRGLADIARAQRHGATVLLLPGGLEGPSAAHLGVEAVLEERDVAGLRGVARDVAARSPTSGGRPVPVAGQPQGEGPVAVEQVAAVGHGHPTGDGQPETAAAPTVE